MGMQELVDLSHRYGCDEAYVLAGGGNTSCKENGVLYIKGSGVQLADIRAEQFVALDFGRLREAARQQGSEDTDDEQGETQALTDMMAARLPGEEDKRPSVETLLHAMFPNRYVMHVHPALVNGMTCGKNGEAACRRLFGGSAVWVERTRPGPMLLRACQKALSKCTDTEGVAPQIVFLQNHGIIVAGDTTPEIDENLGRVVSRLTRYVSNHPDLTDVSWDKNPVGSLSHTLERLFDRAGAAVALFCANSMVLEYVSRPELFRELGKPFTPDHTAYCGGTPLFLEADADPSVAFFDYLDKKGHAPKVVAVRGIGFFALGESRKAADNTRLLFLDAMKICVYARAFGGAQPLPDAFVEALLHGAAYQYRL